MATCDFSTVGKVKRARSAGQTTIGRVCPATRTGAPASGKGVTRGREGTPMSTPCTISKAPSWRPRGPDVQREGTGQIEGRFARRNASGRHAVVASVRAGDLDHATSLRIVKSPR